MEDTTTPTPPTPLEFRGASNSPDAMVGAGQPPTPKRDPRPGQVVRVHQRVKEANAKGEEKDRVQIFEGIVIARRHGSEPGATFTVRKVSHGVGVERIFPLFAPTIAQIETVKQYRIRRAKLHHLRDHLKKGKKLHEVA